MKKLIAIICVSFIAQVCFAQLTGTLHSLASKAWTTGTNQMCGPCHTPHNALSADAPLWSHFTTTATHVPYPDFPDGTMDATVPVPAGISLMCLSCHDGTVALDNYLPLNLVTTTIGGVWEVGTDLDNDHPISFVYNTALATSDGELYNPATKVTGLTGVGTIEADYLFGTAGSKTVECASCHDPHGTGIDKLVRYDNTNSELCLECHEK